MTVLSALIPTQHTDEDGPAKGHLWEWPDIPRTVLVAFLKELRRDHHAGLHTPSDVHDTDLLIAAIGWPA